MDPLEEDPNMCIFTFTSYVWVSGNLAVKIEEIPSYTELMFIIFKNEMIVN